MTKLKDSKVKKKEIEKEKKMKLHPQSNDRLSIKIVIPVTQLPLDSFQQFLQSDSFSISRSSRKKERKKKLYRDEDDDDVVEEDVVIKLSKVK